MRKDYCNPKKSIRKHLTKRKTNFIWLYFVFIFMIFAFGVINMLVSSDLKTEASEVNYPMVEEEMTDLYEIPVEESDTLFPRTTQEDLLYKMIEKEDLDLSIAEEDFVESH